jgi:hypothetical protein
MTGIIRMARMILNLQVRESSMYQKCSYALYIDVRGEHEGFCETVYLVPKF